MALVHVVLVAREVRDEEERDVDRLDRAARLGRELPRVVACARVEVREGESASERRGR